jgi:hypothetical protein
MISMFGVGVRREARVGRDLVVVPDAQRAPARSRGIVVVGKGKVVLGLQPAAIFSRELVEWSTFDHRYSPGSSGVYALQPMDKPTTKK